MPSNTYSESAAGERDRGRGEGADLARGALAGMAGGIAGSLAMNLAQALWTLADRGPRAARELFEPGGPIKTSHRPRWPFAAERQSPTMKAADAITRAVLGERLPRGKRRLAGAAAHFLFGGAVGAVYGVAVEVAPSLSAGAGVPFGAGVWMAADEIGVPLAGLSKPPQDYPVSVHLQSLVSHIFFGWTVELVRRAVRRDS